MALGVRLMREEDIGLGLTLCRLAGWNQIEDDWRRLLTLSPDGVFAAEYRGQACGTASATSYGTRAAWIGMVLVHPSFRRRNIGSTLMERCIEYLKAKHLETIRIDATDQGRPVYLKLGFEDERPIYRYAAPKPDQAPAAPAQKGIDEGLWPAITECDQVAFGADRLALLKLLNAQGGAAVIRASSGIKGYGFARRGFHASYIGPIVAVDAAAARDVILTLLAALPDGEVCWDILPDNVSAKDLATSLGFTVHRRLTRMYLGEFIHPGDLTLIYGTAGFELG